MIPSSPNSGPTCDLQITSFVLYHKLQETWGKTSSRDKRPANTYFYDLNVEFFLSTHKTG